MTKILTALFLVLVYMACGQVANQATNEDSNLTAQIPVAERNSSTQIKTEDCITMDFHYLVIENIIQTSTLRQIYIFLDEKAFSEKNLNTLFTYLSNKYPEPKYLTVFVKTNWAQLGFPSDCPPIGISGKSHPDEYNYHEAIFYRRGENEFFRYNPVLKTSNVKTIILKGKSL